MNAEAITIMVEPETARAFRTASTAERRKLETLLNIWLLEATQSGDSLKEIMRDISRKAQARGLTPTIELNEQQIVELFKQLPPERKRAVWETLRAESDAWWAAVHYDGEATMRRLAAERGLNWAEMGEDERMNLIDDIVHEAREEARR
jgi:hypothetical protein